MLQTIEVGDSTPQALRTLTKLILLYIWEAAGEDLGCLSVHIMCHKWRSVKCVCVGGVSVRESINPRGVRVISWGQKERAKDTTSARQRWMKGGGGVRKRARERDVRRRGRKIAMRWREGWCCQSCAERRVRHGQCVSGRISLTHAHFKLGKHLMLNMTHIPPF